MKNKNIRSANRLPQRTAIASAVMLAFITPAALAQYRPNVEVYVKPGSERNYLGVDGLVPLVESGTSLFFADAKAHMITESSANEVNLGLGYRALTEDQQWAWGVYGAFDYKNTKYDNHFNQLTVGAEMRSREWDFRSNYYQILTDKKFVGLGATNHFAGYGVWRNGVFEEGLSGVDVEVGRLLDISDRYDVRAYLAGYSFKSKEFGAHDDGVRARLEVRPQKNFILGVSLQHDSLFGNVGFVEMRYAFGQSSENGPRTLGERMTDPWKRDQDIVTSGALESDTAGNSVQTTDNAVHINSSVAASGDGSYEHPYKLVSNCDAGKCTDALTSGAGRYNLIRLWQGNSLSTSYTPITLLDGQTLWGQGVDYYSGRTQSGLYPLIRTSSAPAVLQAQGELPPGVESQPAFFPIAGNAGVTLASNGTLGNSVVGVEIYGSGTGIVGYDTWGKVNIDRNNINTLGKAIELVNGDNMKKRAFLLGADAPVSAGETRAQSVAITNNHTMYGGGIVLSNSTTSSGFSEINQTVTISGNDVVSFKYSGIELTNSAGSASRSTQSVAISGNTVTSSVASHDSHPAVSASNSAYGGGALADQTVTLAGNNLNARRSDGIDAQNYASGNSSSAAKATQTLSISGNTIDAGGNHGIVLGNTGGSGSGLATQHAVISGNTLTSLGKGFVGIDVDNHDSGYAGAAQAVTISGTNAVSGFYLGAYASSGAGNVATSSQTVNVSGLSVQGTNPDRAIAKCKWGASPQTVTVGSGNTLDGASVGAATEWCD